MLNDIEYDPISETLWGAAKYTSRIMEFDIESGECIGGFELVDVISKFFSKSLRGAGVNREVTLLRNPVGKLYNRLW